MRLGTVLLLSVLLTACQKGCQRSDRGALSDAKGRVVQKRIGGDEAEQPAVTFEIGKIHERQQLVARAPWHVAGGDWTFFDARTAGGVPFGFGWRQRPSKQPMSWGEGILTVPDASAGAELVRLFARAFQGKPPPAEAAEPLRFAPFSIAVLGERMARDPEGSFSGSGSWHATKLFLQRPGIEAEVFFNFNLTTRQGEFTEKDADYADDMLAFLARELRDGPPRPQTPENDSRVTLVGPKPGAFRDIAPAGAEFRRFEANGSRIVYTLRDGAATRVKSVPCEGEQAAVDIIRLEHDLVLIQCAPGTDDPCVVEESTPKTAGIMSSNDPRTFHLVERARKRVTVLRGPWGEDASLTSGAVSPDGTFFALIGWKKRTVGTGNYRTLHFGAVSEPCTTVSFAQGERLLDVIGWSGKGAGLRAIVQRGSEYDPDDKPSWFEVDPRTAAQGRQLDAAASGKDETLSPDGKHRVSCNGNQEVSITNVATGEVRRFPVAPRERRGFGEDCPVSWMGNRYLAFSPERTGFIDVDTLKLSFPFEPDKEPEGITFDSTLTWVVQDSSAKTPLRVARVTVHKDAH